MNLRLFAVLVSVVVAAASFGQLTYVKPDGTKATLDADFSGSEVNVIVELREAPLFVAIDGAKSAGARTLLSHLGARLDELERDVRRIHDGLRPVAANAKVSEPRVRARFTRVYAGASLRVDRQALARIRALAYVKSVHYEREVQAHLASSVPKVGAPSFWSSTGLRGRGVTVAVIDTGIDYHHAAFGGGFGPGARVAGGYDTFNNDADPMDDAGHGTHVAAIVGANGGGLTGVAPEVTLLAYKALNAGGGGSDTSILAAIERAADPNGDGDGSDRADVVNMSLGRISGAADDPLSVAVENASRSGTLFVISSGNSGGFYEMSAPADAPSALAVGASDLQDVLAEFTSKGPAASSNAIKPEIVAPGVDIVSARRGGGTFTASGTSMAAPHVAGAAALLRALHPAWTAAEIKSALVNSAVALGNDVMAEGAGRLDLSRAALVNVTSTPSVLSFGRSNIDLAEWTSAKEVTVVNHSAGAVTLAAAITGTKPGIDITVEPASIALAAGETRTVRISLKVTNSLVPGPRVGSLAYSGQVVLTGGAQELHLPWAFIKAARIVVAAQNDEPYAILVAGGGKIVAAGVVEPERRRFEAVLPAGDYDVLVRPFITAPNDRRIRFLFAEQQKVETSLEVPIDLTSATDPVVLGAKGPNGLALTQSDRWCLQGLTIVFPDSNDDVWASLTVPSVNQFFTTNVSERFQLLPVQWCLGITEQNGNDLFIAQHPILRGVSGAVSSTVEVPEWTSTAVQMDVPAGTPRPWVRLGAATPVWRSARRGTSASIHAHWRFDEPRWSGTLHMTPDRHPRIGAAAVFEIAASDEPEPGRPDLPSPVKALAADLVRLLDGGFAVYGSTLDVTASPALHIERTGSLRIGAVPRWPAAFIGEIGADFYASLNVRGPLGEDRMLESFRVEPLLTDGAGNRIELPRDRGGRLPKRDAYHLEMGLPATANDGALRVTSDFDTRRPDAMPPQLSSLRVVDAGGAVTSRLAPGAAGALVFSALDLVNGLSAPAATSLLTARVLWRPHGGTTWQPLTVTKTGEDVGPRDELLHDPAGALYRADLAPATAATGGPADLRIELADPSGNTLTFEGERVFHVGSARRRAAGR